MPALIFIQKDDKGVSPFFVKTQQVLSSRDLEWTPCVQDLMNLSRDDLVSLASMVYEVKHRDSKSELSNVIIGNWSEILSKHSPSFFAGGSHQGGGRGSDEGGDDNKDDDEGSNPDPYDFDEGDGNDSFKLTVQRMWGTPTFKVFDVSPHYPLHSLKSMISMVWHIKPSNQKLMMNGIPIDTNDFLSFHHLGITSSCVLQVAVRGRGGVAGRIPVQKTYLKKNEAIDKMKQKVREQYVPDPELNIPNDNLPVKFIEFLNEEKVKIGELLSLKGRLGEQFIRTCLKQLDVETLVSLKNIFDTNRAKRGEKNLTVNEKIAKALNLIYPQVKVFENCLNKLSFLQGELMADLVQMFNEEFSVYSEQQGTITVSGQGFFEKVKGELERPDDRPVGVSEEAVANCSIS
eukprot:Skav234983  [mRNA]  locus=scaffold122:207824:209032:+ [translate_table: standard]